MKYSYCAEKVPSIEKKILSVGGFLFALKRHETRDFAGLGR
jgi:hypothetical protein